MCENIAICRGKCVNTGEWVKGRFVFLRGFNDERKTSARIYKTLAETDCGDFYPDWYEVMPDTVGEFTGLFDRNGKMIFEGDLLRTKKYGVCIGQSNVNDYDTFFVVYRPGGFRLERNNPDRGFNLTDSIGLEIVGNIYDNPELLPGAGKGAERDA